MFFSIVFLFLVVGGVSVGVGLVGGVVEVLWSCVINLLCEVLFFSMLVRVV